MEREEVSSATSGEWIERGCVLSKDRKERSESMDEGMRI